MLVYSKTAGYRHDSIPVAIDALALLGKSLSITTTFSEDENLFTPSMLSTFDIITFLSNSDQVLTTSGELALQGFLASGGSLIGLHAATACLFNDQAFATSMGALFDYHPTISNAVSSS